MEISDIPVAVLKAALHVILEAFENLSRTVSRLIEVRIPDPMARPIAIPGDRVGCTDWRHRKVFVEAVFQVEGSDQKRYEEMGSEDDAEDT
ncbi:hypothetical protein BGZ80_009268 [Entomortierella chlamydospora]|uniref:Uncharacterized protein n=1 Tax=Entomortierella chlamydospora TaxID=101097 RepID=A0A9P6T438_9FUNG|nr:hypothetical protein BGZ80_009268 [Entomortierella chlamydospora]